MIMTVIKYFMFCVYRNVVHECFCDGIDEKTNGYRQSVARCIIFSVFTLAVMT